MRAGAGGNPVAAGLQACPTHPQILRFAQNDICPLVDISAPTGIQSRHRRRVVSTERGRPMAEISDSWRRLWGRRITRRRLMAGTALGAAGLATAAVLGCKDDGGDGGDGGLGSLSISHPPYYIDGDTVADFQEESGISVSYTQDISGNNEFFGKIREPLSRGQSIGRDIIVLTDWMAGRLLTLG